MFASTRALDLRAVHGGAGRARQRRDGADVVEVAVGDEDRLDLHAERSIAASSRSGSSPGSTISTAPLGARAVADDVGVLLDRPDRERAHVEARALSAFALAAARPWRFLRMRRLYIHMSV